MKKAIFRLSILAVLIGGGWFGYHSFRQSQTRQEKIATATVQRSDVTIRAFTRGELKPVRTYSLYSPNLNGTIQVTALAPNGALAREKNLAVEYDDSELLGTIEGDKLTLDTTDENIKYLTLTMQVQTSKNDMNKLLAEFAVKRAELQVKKNPVLDPITQKSNILALAQAVRALAQTVTNIEMLKAQQDSQMAVYNSNRRRSVQALGLDQQRLLQTKTLAPMTGLVAIKPNRAGNFNFGQQMPDIRPGDQLQAGMNVADILDLSEMELTAKVGELDRANLKEGQEVQIQLDAIPEQRFPGKIKTLSGTATSDVFSGDPSKKFDISFSVDMRALLTGVGMKKEDIDQIKSTASENAKKNLVSFVPTVTGGRGGGGAPGMDFGGGMPGGPPADLAALAAMAGGGRGQGGGQGQGGFGGRGQGGGQAQGGPGGGGRGQGGGMSNLSDADRQKLSDLRQKIRDASSDAEREKLQQQQQEMMQKLGIQGRGGRQGGPGGPGGDVAGGQGRGGRQGGPGGDMAGGQGRGQRGGGGGGGGGGQGGSNVFVPTQEDLNNAALPIPPEQDSGVTKLLRPGLLADVEIQVESIPNALHVPSQAIYRQNGKPIVYVQGKDGKFTAREVALVKQSESFMVLASGVEAGEVVALSDPTLSKAADKMSKTEEKKGSGTGMPMPGAN
jgi:hypothetical protein